MWTRGIAFMVMFIGEGDRIEAIRVCPEPHPAGPRGRKTLCLNAYPADPIRHPVPYELAGAQLETWARRTLPSSLHHLIEWQKWPALPKEYEREVDKTAPDK